MRTISDLDDFTLLRRFVETNSQEAFSQLFDSHIDLVYSVCLRETHDPMLAQDVTQAVFLTLFHKAPTIRKGTVLAGWLFNTSRFAARNTLRQQSQRKAAEQELIQAMSQSAEHTETWQAIEPLLHEAIASLRTKEREVILLRYFEDKSIKEVGLQLNTTEHAAQMRVSRALEKMKQYLRKNGVTVPVALLSTLMGQHVVQSAPLLCVQAVGHLVSGVVAGSTTMASAGLTLTKAQTISQGVIKSMFITKLKVASVAAALGTTVIVGVLSTRPSTMRNVAAKGAHGTMAQQNAALDKQYFDTRDERLERAKVLRAKWRVWAATHQGQLQQMLHAPKNDRSAFNAVWQSIPMVNTDAASGITPTDLVPGGDVRAAMQSGKMIFGWAGVNKAVFGARFNPATLKDPRVPAKEVQQRHILEELENNYATHRDIVIATSMNPGPAKISLWASGRITEQERLPYDKSPGGNERIATYRLMDEHKELVPPYEFLQG